MEAGGDRGPLDRARSGVVLVFGSAEATKLGKLDVMGGFLSRREAMG